MKNQFVPYELTLKLRELGFDEEFFGYFSSDKVLQIHITTFRLEDLNKGILAPLYQQAFDWFRLKGLLSSYGDTSDTYSERNGYVITKFGNSGKEYLDKNWEVGTYEEARLACLKKLIEIVKENKL